MQNSRYYFQRMALLACLLSASSIAPSQNIGGESNGTPFPPLDGIIDKTEVWSSIINGTVTAQYPAVAALLRKESNGLPSQGGHCTATLIGCRHLLTAAHCVAENDSSIYTAWFQQLGGVQVKRIVYKHPNFTGCPPGKVCATGDIAVVELAQPVQGISTVSITKTTIVPSGDEGTVVGYGLSEGTKLDYGIKRRGDVRASSCSKPFKGAADTAWLCWRFSSLAVANTCSGDSGGPLFASNHALAGVTSRGEKLNCSIGDEAYDSRVSAYAHLIMSVAPGEIMSGSCGTGSQAGTKEAPITMVVNANYKPDGRAVNHAITIPQGVLKATFSVQGVGQDFKNVQRISIEPRALEGGIAAANRSCNSAAIMNFAYCSVSNPQRGNWIAQVRAVSSHPDVDTPFIYQVVATIYR